MTVDAVDRLGVDAGIVFSDLLVPLEAMGAPVEFVPGTGPVIANPDPRERGPRAARRRRRRRARLRVRGIRLARAALPPNVPLLGFGGAPFTLASYLIEGGTSRTYEHTKLVMYRDEGRWHVLLERLARSMTAFLARQARPAHKRCSSSTPRWAASRPPTIGASSCRTRARWSRRCGAPHPACRSSCSGPGAPACCRSCARRAPTSIGLDWRVDLDDAWRTLGPDVAVQGNLDPAVLFAEPAEIRRAAADVLARAAGRPGHVFNLGHGILPRTPVDHVRALVDAVHEIDARRPR